MRSPVIRGEERRRGGENWRPIHGRGHSPCPKNKTRGLPYMTSTTFWFFTPSPLSVRKIYTVCPQFLTPPPSVRTSYMEAPESEERIFPPNSGADSTIFPFFFMSRQFLTFNGGQGHLLNPIHFGGERGDHVSVLGWNLTFPSPTLLVNAQRGYLTIFSPAKLIVFRRKVFLSRIGAASEQIIIWFIRWVVTFHTSESRQCFRA